MVWRLKIWLFLLRLQEIWIATHLLSFVFALISLALMASVLDSIGSLVPKWRFALAVRGMKGVQLFN
jgi:hypothetical protein